MKTHKWILSIPIILALLFSPVFSFNHSAVFAQAGSVCSSSSPASAAYAVMICYSTPAANATLTGDVPITVLVTVGGTNPGVQRVIFYLNGSYLLTDYQTSYTFTLPTAKFVDGAYSLAVNALMRDGFVTQQTVLPVSFNNGVTTPPVNTNVFQPTNGRTPGPSEPFTVTAAGDGASGETKAVAVTNLISSINPNLFLYLGDVYEKGTPVEFYNWYGKQGINFGTFRNITNPTIGNHEYENGVAPGYFDYWNNVPNYYSYNAGGWHFISLNSNYTQIGVNPQSAQYQWLQQDLSSHDQACTIVYYHHPLFNIGPEGSTTAMNPIWALMVQHKVEIVLNGHDHTYQRWIPLDGAGQSSSQGITEFVVGASGHGTQTIKKTDNRVAYSIDTNPTAFGALSLVLNSGGASFNYKNTSGTVLDSGTIPCLHTATDTTPPSVPTGVSGSAINHYQVGLSWLASSDNVGVAGYTVRRNGTTLGTVSGSTHAYVDSSALPATTYNYTIDAFDSAGNHSAQSSPVVVTTPGMPASITYLPEADTYVSSSSPGSNYGTSTSIRLDNSPDIHGYIRFSVQGTAGFPITKARLLIYTNAASTLGIQAKGVANTTWGELTTNYNNAPALGSVISSSGVVAGNSWVSIDISPYITGNGLYTIGVSTPSSSAISIASRELPANSPQLVLEFQGQSQDTQAPTVPTNLAAVPANATQVNLNWSASTDNVGVTGYTVYRNGSSVGTVSGATLTYSDITVTPSTTYSYVVDAFDLAGNHSAGSTPASVTTPALPDSQAPSVPTNLAAVASSPTQVDLSWAASTDNVGVTGYSVYRGGSLMTTVSGSTLAYSDTSVVPATSYSYTVDAFDLAGNHSAQTNSVSITTPATQATSLTFSPVADTWVNASSPTTNYGTSVSLRLDGSPDVHSYLRFVVSGTGGKTISQVNLLLYTNNASSQGFGIYSVADTTWGESTTNYNNAPTFGPLLVSSGSIPVNTWITVNITGSISGDGLYSFGVNTPSSTAFNLSSKEAVGFVPQLIINFGSAPTPTNTPTPTGTPPPVATPTPTPFFTPTPTQAPDSQAPTVPTGLTATSTVSTKVDLTWNSSTDNVGVTGYTIYRDSTLLATVAGNVMNYSDLSVAASTTYQYTVDAFDLAGNHSLASTSASVTTPAFVDTAPPTVPSNLAGVSSSPSQIDLNWSQSTDNVGVTGYTIYRDGSQLTTVSGSSQSYSDTTVSPSTTYAYTVDAFDLAGNYSNQSTAVNVTSQSPPPPSSTFTPDADTYVNASSPTTNFGTTTTLRLDASPDLHSYIRFNVQGTNGRPVVQARLRVFTNNSSTPGIQIWGVSDTGWGEKTMVYSNAPALGSVLSSSGAVSANSWVTFDVTSYITADGAYSFGITTPSSTAMSVASRESGANAPQLILDY